VGRRKGFIWPLEGRPVQACELLWRDVLGGRLVESVDYLLSCQCVMRTLLGLRVGVYDAKNRCRGGRLRKEAGGN